jgi:predicted dinucleotide-binding enzyme
MESVCDYQLLRKHTGLIEPRQEAEKAAHKLKMAEGALPWWFLCSSTVYTAVEGTSIVVVAIPTVALPRQLHTCGTIS